MSKRTSEQFWRLVLGGFGRRGGDGCVGDEELAIFAAGEPMEGGTRRRVARHVARCPACLEQTLVLRRLSGATHPLFHRTGADVRSAAWRPAATVAAALVLAGLLYLGGVGLLQEREAALVPAVPMTEQAQPRPAEPREAVSAVPDREGGMAAAKPDFISSDCQLGGRHIEQGTHEGGLTQAELAHPLTLVRMAYGL